MINNKNSLTGFFTLLSVISYVAVQGGDLPLRLKSKVETQFKKRPLIQAKEDLAKVRRIAYVAFVQDKASVPSRDEISAAKASLSEVFREDFQKANAADISTKFNLLKEVAVNVAQLLETEANLASRYAIFEVSIDIGKLSGDSELTNSLIDRFQAAFQVDVTDLRYQVFKFWHSQIPTRNKDVSSRRTAYRRIAVELEPFLNSSKNDARWEFALKCVELMEQCYSNAGDKESRAKRVAESRQLARLVEEKRKVNLLIQQLANSKNRADDNLGIGIYYCFECQDWTTGLSYLREGSDQQLAIAAKLDANAEDATWKNTGDVWWELALLDEFKSYRTAMQRRAVSFYSKSIPKASGLELAKLEKRIREVEAEPTSTNTQPMPQTKSESVELGLRWLASQQMADGSWSLVGPYSDGGANENRTAATALAILAFYGAGETQLDGARKASVKRGLAYLVKKVDKNGFFAGREPSRQQMYAQALATSVVIEAYRVSKDEDLKAVAQRAIIFAEWSQSKLGGWRYDPRIDADTSVSGWFVDALSSGKKAGLKVNDQVFKNFEAYLESVGSQDRARYSYKPRDPPSLSMTASALCSRICLGWTKDSAAIISAVRDDFLPNAPKAQDEMFSVYYLYHATKVVAFTGGDSWKQWRAGFETAKALQMRDGKDAGSVDPSKDQFGASGGRLYTTCLYLYCQQIMERTAN
jgi:DNA-binding transcriptional regulator GbsR (MarR family)